MNSKTFNQFDAGTDLVVIDRDPEMADYDNPRGEIIGHQAYVRAYNAHGDTRILTLGRARFEDEVLPAAEKLAEAFAARLANHGKLPVGFDRWVEGRALYGSDAYIEHGQDDDVEWEKRVEEDAAFA
jgi:hypothetical protein